jgi:hypothetical protein
MEALQAIPRPAIIEQETVDQSPPWTQEEAEAKAAPCAQTRRPEAPDTRSLPRDETVHWSIVLLTMATATSVLFSSCAIGAARPRELLPVMIVTPAH